MEKNIHYFLAVSLPKEAKLMLHEHSERLKRELSFARWVHPKDYHITLAFLGNASAGQLTKTKELVENGIHGTQAFPLTISHLGIFGRKDSPRIFWAGVNKEARLHTLRNLVFAACTEAGFQLETRPFSPHITLARKWSGTAPFSSAILIKNGDLISFKPEEVVLYKTNLGKTPKYEAIISFPLIHE